MCTLSLGRELKVTQTPGHMESKKWGWNVRDNWTSKQPEEREVENLACGRRSGEIIWGKGYREERGERRVRQGGIDPSKSLCCQYFILCICFTCQYFYNSCMLHTVIFLEIRTRIPIFNVFRKFWFQFLYEYFSLFCSFIYWSNFTSSKRFDVQTFSLVSYVDSLSLYSHY